MIKHFSIWIMTSVLLVTIVPSKCSSLIGKENNGEMAEDAAVSPSTTVSPAHTRDTDDLLRLYAASTDHKDSVNVPRDKRSECNDAPLVVLSCGDTCFCFMNNLGYKEEFRIICNNTGDQAAVMLSSSVFDDAEMPSFFMTVYVRVEDVRTVVITSDFVSHWTAYTSCAMDLWNAGDIILPSVPIARADTEAFEHIFSGMGIRDSRLAALPAQIFADFEEYGLSLVNVTMPVLNLYNLVYPRSGNLRYFKMEEVVLGVLQGPQSDAGEDDGSCCHINMDNLLPDHQVNGVWIINSVIGLVEENALSLTSNQNLRFGILNSEIGMIRRSGIKLKGRIVPEIRNSTLNLAGEDTLIKDESMKMTANNNLIILPEKIFNKWNCEHNDIENNEFIIINTEGKKINSNYNSNGDVTTTSSSPEETPLLYSFLHPSCIDQNKILNIPIVIQNEVKISEISDLSTTTKSATTVTASTESDFSLVSNVTQVSQNLSNILDTTLIVSAASVQTVQVHKVFVYLVLVSMAVLFVSVVVLLAMLVFSKKRSHDYEDDEEDDHYTMQDTGRERRPSLMYVPGSSIYGDDMWPTSTLQK